MGDERKGRRVSIARATLAGAGADALVGAASFLAIPYLVKRLGVVDFGVVALLAVVGGQLAVVQQALAVAVTRRIAEARGRGERDRLAGGARAAWLAALLCAAAITVAVVLIGGAVWPTWSAAGRFSAASLLPAAALTLAAQPLFGVAQALFFAAESFDVAAASRAAFFLARIAAAVTAVACGGGLLALLYAQAAVDIGAAGLFYAATARRRGAAAPAELRTWARSIFSLAVPLAGANLAQAVLLDGDKLLVSTLLGSAALTYYMVPYTAGFRLLMLAPALGTALQPRLARLAAAGRAEHGRELAQRWTRITLAPAAALVLLLIAVAPEGLGWWLGREFAARASSPARALAVGLFAIAVATPANAVVRAQIDPRALRRLYALQLAPYALAALLLTRAWGIDGAAIAWSARAVFDAAAILRLARRAAGAPLVGGAAASISLSGVATFAAACALGGDALSAPLRAALAAGGFALVAVFTLRPGDLRLLLAGARRAASVEVDER